MNLKPAMTVVSSLVIVAAVFGNAGPTPLPKDRKVAEPPVRFEGIDKHTDYIFHLSYYVYYGSGGTFVEVKDSGEIKLIFQRKDRTPDVSYMAILAMDRKKFELRKKDDPSLKWLTTETEGVLAAKLTPPPTTMPFTANDVPVTTYRVTLKDGKLNAETVEDKKKDEKPSSLLPAWTFAIVSSLSIAWLGIWFARRDGGSASSSRTR